MKTSVTPRNALPVRAAEPCCEGSATALTLDTVAAAALADRLKALADATRLRMLDLLAQQREPLCVCEITAQFEQHQPTISHHLRLLRQAGLISGEKRGIWSYYWATDLGRQSLMLTRSLQ